MDNVGGYQGYHNRLKRTSSELYNQSTPPTNGDGNNNNNNSNNGAREQERMMPIANVIRIMRKVLPAHAKISDDAKETIQECVSEYISFITAEANDRCRSEHRKTVTAEDLLFSMSKLGFHDYVQPLSLYLRRYRHLEGADFRGLPRPDQFLHNPPPTTRAHGPMPTTLGGGPMAHDLGYGSGGAMWEGGGGGVFIDGSGLGPSQGHMMMNGFDLYGPPPPYK